MQNRRKSMNKTCSKTSVFLTSTFFGFSLILLPKLASKFWSFFGFFRYGPLRGSKRRLRGSKSAPRGPKRSPGKDFKGVLASFLEVLGRHVGSCLECSLDMFGLQVLHMSRFMCFCALLTFLARGGYSLAVCKMSHARISNPSQSICCCFDSCLRCFVRRCGTKVPL